MSEQVQNFQLEEVMAKLETMEDEVLAVQYLKKFNDKTRDWGLLIMNKDQSLDHASWKSNCDKLQKEIEDLVSEIFSAK